jgi:ferredoxin
MVSRRSPIEAIVQPRSSAARLRIDPVACDGIGMCAHLAPGVISQDSWGYPMLPSAPLGRADLRAAQAAVSGCPRRALFIVKDDRNA